MFPKPSSSPSPSTSTASSLPSAVADLVRRMVGPAADSAAADLVPISNFLIKSIYNIPHVFFRLTWNNNNGISTIINCKF